MLEFVGQQMSHWVSVGEGEIVVALAAIDDDFADVGEGLFVPLFGVFGVEADFDGLVAAAAGDVLDFEGFVGVFDVDELALTGFGIEDMLKLNA